MFASEKMTAPDLAKGFVSGLLAGLFAAFLMEQFQALWTAVGKKSQESKPGRPGPKPKPTTVKAADAIAVRVVGHKVRKKDQKVAGAAVHYAMGGTSAAIYGMLAEVAPAVRAGEGAAFGAAVWLIADEASLPALGLTKAPTKIPVSTHVYALASHLVYGVVTEAMRRAFRQAL